jgi:hypothetical protein
MPPPTPTPVRAALFRRWRLGHPVAELARDFRLAQRTVRDLVQRFQLLGSDGIPPSYSRPSPDTPTDPLRLQAILLRQQHPSWGAGLIRVLLRRDYDHASVPAERTLQRWFRAAGLGPAPRGRRSACTTAVAGCPHDVWQMDAKERVALQSGQQVSWLRLVDECSGAVLWTEVFPPRPLGSGATHRGPDQPAGSLPTLGSAGRLAGGQRCAVGFVG